MTYELMSYVPYAISIGLFMFCIVMHVRQKRTGKLSFEKLNRDQIVLKEKAERLLRAGELEYLRNADLRNYWAQTWDNLENPHFVYELQKDDIRRYLSVIISILELNEIPSLGPLAEDRSRLIAIQRHLEYVLSP